MRLLAFILCLIVSVAHGKVYDCFTFFNEIDLLKIRFEELYEVVDHFVIVEAEDTFRGNPKPMYFAQNRHHFQKYLDKVIYVHVGKSHFSSPWDRERYQRNQIQFGLIGCTDEDIILVSDLDEFIDARKWPHFLQALEAHPEQIVGCESRVYRWFLNRQSTDPWIGTAVCKYKVFRRCSAEEIRGRRGSGIVIPQSGWHFSNMGGLATYVQKIESFSHDEVDRPEFKEPIRIDTGIRAVTHLVSIDETFPKFIREQEAELLEKGLIDYEGRALGQF